MFVKVWSAAAVVALTFSSAALAQSLADVGGPREMPPAGYSQQQYVDSRGCVFLRAGLGGQVRWVPRIGDNRRPICNATPTFGRAAREAVAALEAAEDSLTPAAPAEAPRVAATQPRATPVAPVAPRPAVTARVPAESYVPAPVANAAPAPVLRPRPATVAPAPVTRLAANGSTGRRIACTTSAPVAERIALTNGGSVIVCTRGDGTLDGWRAPIYPDGAPVGASILPPARDEVAAGTRAAGYAPLGQPQRAAQAATTRAPAVAATIPVPEGYKLSWEDDRLNPLRGVRTLQGEAQQDQVWTRKVPATAVADAPRPRAERQVAVTISTKGQPQAGLPAPSARPLYIQVGAFGDPANAQGSTARLQAAGLPVAISRSRGLQVVMAGPFGSQADAARALSIARGAGFGDAFVR